MKIIKNISISQFMIIVSHNGVKDIVWEFTGLFSAKSRLCYFFFTHRVWCSSKQLSHQSCYQNCGIWRCCMVAYMAAHSWTFGGGMLLVAWQLDKLQLHNWAFYILEDVGCRWGLLGLHTKKRIYSPPILRES